MAWSTPTSRSPGYTVPSTEWNKNTVDNPIALRAGEIAISGQAAEALIKASSGSQLGTVTVPARGAVLYAGASGAPSWLAAGTDGYVLTAAGAGADPAWEEISTFIKRYAVTVADVVNTASKTNTLSFTVPANAMADGDVIIITAATLVRNGVGSGQTATVTAKWGSTEVDLVSGLTLSTNGTDQKHIFRWTFQRVGSDVWVHNGAQSLDTDWRGGDASNAAGASVLASATFNSDQTVAIAITLSTADTTFHWKTQKARAIRIGETA